MCVYLFGCQNKSTCFQKLKSTDVFYAGREATGGPPQELAVKWLVCIYIYIYSEKFWPLNKIRARFTHNYVYNT